MRLLHLCTLTGSNILHREASTSDLILIYKSEFPRFKTNQKQALANAFLLCHPPRFRKGHRKETKKFASTS